MSKKVRVNGQIRVSSVMVVGAEGEQLGVLSIEDAIVAAEDAEMDLVEVAPNSDPPVCKVMDYGKYKYRQNKKAHDAKKRQKIIKIKEVKITPNTEEHDIQFKLTHARRFLKDGSKVKVTVFFRGRQITHKELGFKILDRFVKELEEMSEVEEQPKQEGRKLALIMAPKVIVPQKENKQSTNETDTDKDGEINAEAQDMPGSGQKI